MKKTLMTSLVAAAAVASVATVTMGVSASSASEAAGSTASICSPSTGISHVANSNYYNLITPEKSQDNLCLSFVGGQSAFKITSAPAKPKKAWSYPNISSGWNWGENSCGGVTGKCIKFPVEAKKDGEPEITEGSDFTGQGNVSNDIWFNAPGNTQTKGQDNGTEVMLWLRDPGVNRTSKTRVSIEGITWYVTEWRATNKNDGVSWNYVDLTSVNQRSVLKNYYLNPVYRYVESRGWLSQNSNETAIDFGSELTHGGSGSKYSFNLKGMATTGK